MEQGPSFRIVKPKFPVEDPAWRMLVIVRNGILRPIAGSLFDRPAQSSLKPNSKLQAQYRRTTRSFNELIALLKAA